MDGPAALWTLVEKRRTCWTKSSAFTCVLPSAVRNTQGIQVHQSRSGWDHGERCGEEVHLLEGDEKREKDAETKMAEHLLMFLGTPW